MKTMFKILTVLMATVLASSCNSSGGGSDGGSSGGGGSVIKASGVNIGNISTIPTGVNSTSTSVVVTNNLSDMITFKSATYQLFNSGSSSAEQSVSSAGSPVDVSQCSRSIASHASCNVMVQAPANTLDGQYLLKMVFTDKANNKDVEVSQIVSYSSTVPANANGVRYSSINTAIHNDPGNITTLSIPFVLTQSFSHLYATSKNDNPAFAPTISCPGGQYSAGEMCTLYVKINISGTSDVVSGDITVSDTLTSSRSIKSNLLKGVDGYVFGVPITVTQVTSGNLVTSATNVVVSPSTGASPQTITLLNNGNATVTGISVVAATPAVVSSNTCSSLAAGASCTFVVNATSSISGQTNAVVNYNTGATSGDTTGNLSFNIAYIASTSAASMTMTSGQGSLTNTQINTTNSYNIVVTNTGSVTLNNMAFSSLAVSGLSYDPLSTCRTGTHSLAPGNSCTLILTYSPTAIASASSVTIRASADYTNAGGQQETYSNVSMAVSYSAINGNAFFYITPNYTSFAIRANGQDTASQTFNLVNAGSEPATVNTIVQTPTQTAFSITGGTCVDGTTNLAANGGTCTIITTFGPTTSTITNTTNQLQVGYKPNSSYTSDTQAFANLAFNSSPAALVSISAVNVTGTGVAGNGLSATPYTFTNSPVTGTQIAFSVTYSNSGTANASNFNVALNGLPVGYAVNAVGTTCGYGVTTSTLNAGSTCTVAFKAVDSSGLYNPYALSGPINFGLPGFSYTDANTGLNKQLAPTFASYASGNTVYVTANKLATISTTVPTWTVGSTNNYTFTGTSDGSVIIIPTTNGQIPTIPNAQLAGFTVGSSGTCTIASGTCSISITSPVGMPPKTYYFNYLVAPSGGYSTGIIQQGSFTLN